MNFSCTFEAHIDSIKQGKVHVQTLGQTIYSLGHGSSDLYDPADINILDPRSNFYIV